MKEYAVVRKHSEDKNSSAMVAEIADRDAACGQAYATFMEEVSRQEPDWYGKTGSDKWTMMFAGWGNCEPYWIHYMVEECSLSEEDVMIDDAIKDAVLYHMRGLTGEEFHRDLVDEIFTEWYIDLQGEEDEFFDWLSGDAEIVAEKVVKHLEDTGYFV